ncbi:MAG: extracellular solute-binding protein [Actinomycetota bacterium]|nr:extracellular solute-binding protein [Actinomycetota bacterium]
MLTPRTFARTVVAAGAVLTLAACGGSPTAAPSGGGNKEADSGPTEAEQLYEEIGALSGQERRDRLVELAAEEDGLNVYTSMTSDVADAVTEAFSDEFDIDVSLYRAGSETVLQRILQEQDAAFPGNDIVETNSAELGALSKEGVMAEYTGERRDLVPEAGQGENWTATRFNLFAPSWNTELVSGDMIPTSWEDLADPKYDGILSMELADYDWYMALTDYWLEQGKSREEVDQLFADMVDGAKLVKGHTVQGELMSAGEFGVTASNYTYIVERAKQGGAPVDYQPLVEPVIARPNGAGLMKTAANPASAMLFMDWLLEEGQAVIAEESLTPSIVEGGDPLAGVELYPVDGDKLLEEGDEWSARYDELLAGGEVIAD